jgi:four helix bundle protein
MGTVKRFEDLEIWQLSRSLLNLVYSDFRDCRDFTFKSQVTGAGLSVMNNIAEGFSRDSDREFKQFLNIAKGSDGEVQSMYYVAEDQNYATKEVAFDRRKMTRILSIKITNFMTYLKK